MFRDKFETGEYNDNAGTDALKPEGATDCPSVQAVVEQADTIFLSLPDGAIVNQVAEEIAAVANPRADFVIDLSTIGPDASRRAAKTLAARNIAFGDAPVSGGDVGAREARLSIMIGGETAAVEARQCAFGGAAAGTGSSRSSTTLPRNVTPAASTMSPRSVSSPRVSSKVPRMPRVRWRLAFSCVGEIDRTSC